MAETNLPDNYTTRGASLKDVDIATGLMNEYSKRYLGTKEASRYVIHNEWESPGFDPESDIRLVFSPTGKLIGYAEVWDTFNPPVHPWVWWCIHPDYPGEGVGPYLLKWAENRAQKAFPRCPSGSRVSFRSGADHSITPAKRSMEEYGMENIRHSFHMRIKMENPPPEPNWPKGIRLKVFDLEHDDLEEVYRADVDAFRDHFGFVESPFEEGFERFKHFRVAEESYAPGLWFLAIAEGSKDNHKIAGICLNRKRSYEDPEMGWVSTLGVLKPFRQRGIGLALLLFTFGEYYRRGFPSVGLGVDAENLTGALQLYEKAGMRVYRQFDLYEKEIRPGMEISVQSLED